MSYRRIAVIAVAAASLALGGAITDASSADQPAQPKSAPVAKKVPPARAGGLIIKTKIDQSPTKVLAAARSSIGGRATVTSARHIGSRTAVVRFSSLLDRDDALAAARTIEKRPDVVSAVPDMLHHVAANRSPVVTNDTYFSSLRYLWDPSTTPHTGGNTSWPVGGYSTRAPNLWRSTYGSSKIVVAVLDTGVTNHKDFNANRLTGGGYDFASVISGIDQTRDGDDWDPNPADPGDWETENDCGYTHPAFLSSWHGTHTAGLIAAAANNGMGVAGVAPSVKFAPFRVAGRCGAFDSDIAAAITWSTGGHVDGVPDNPKANWAKVVNLSMSFDDEEAAQALDPTPVQETCDFFYTDVVAAARERGAVVVGAAGNGFNSVKYSSPASCPGVFTVGAVTSDGFMPGYSNFDFDFDEHIIDMLAFGGSDYEGGPGDSALSTYNTGTKGPVSATYTRMFGTSVSAAMVSGAAALLYSAGMTTSEQVEAGLQAAVRPFPYEDGFGDVNCGPPKGERHCGAGILDLGQVQALLKGKRPAITGTPKVGQTLTTKSGYGEWNNSNAGFLYQWYRGSDPIEGATTTSYKLTSADLGQRIKVKLTPKIEAFAPLFHTSVATAEVT